MGFSNIEGGKCMSNSWFRFKRFRIEQGGSAMKVGTDGVLLGAWSRIVPEQSRLLDIGTGTGLIALMMAQRREICDAESGFRVEALEIDEASAVQARENVEASPWADAVRVIPESLQHFTARYAGPGYDHIVSNPPYFVDSLRCPDPARSAARHADTLPFHELIDCVSRLLAPEGIFSVILPPEGMECLMALASERGLSLWRRTVVVPAPGLPVKRVLAEFGKKMEGCPVENVLAISTPDRSDFSEEYKTLTRDFYLKF